MLRTSTSIHAYSNSGVMTSEARLHDASLLAMLLDVPSVGPHRANTLLGSHGSPEAAVEELRSTATSERIKDFFASADLGRYRKSIEDTWALGGDVLLWTDQQYPENLDDWAARPPLLFIKGDLSSLQVRSLALVGRVDPDEQGITAAKRFARACVDANITVVSGLARGIDAASHQAALEGGGRTYAVLGHGLDFVYPKENASLYERIVERGALITQFRTGVGPQRWTFPMRNELMCTLALGTVIVQGADQCGSNIQADFSFKHGRPVFVLSRNLKDMPQWAVRHVDKGATVVRYFEDALAVVDGSHDGATQQDLFAAPTLSEASVTKCAIFDLDGVIIDTREATARSLLEVARSHGAKEATLERARNAVTMSPPKALSSLGVADSWTAYKADYTTVFSRHLADVETNEPMVAALRALSDRGYRLGIVTSQPRSRVQNMIPADIRGLFDSILTYNDVKRDKAAGIEQIMLRVGGSVGRTIYVGDTPADIVGARKAGVHSIGVLWGFSSLNELQQRSPDRLVSSPDELVEAVIEVIP